MLKEMKIRLIGKSPLLCHNGILANPLNKFTKQIGEITSKRKKTDADHEQVAKLEFFGGLYPQAVSNGAGPVVPSRALRKTLINGARKDRLGKQFEAGVFVLDDVPILYDGPRTAAEMWEDGRFAFTVPVGVNNNKVMRTRPRFDNWSLEFTIEYDDELVNPAHVETALTKAGRQIGLLDGRPEFGRFVWELA